MDEWIPSKLPEEKAQTRTVKGMHFDVFVSPYDTPEAVRAFKDEKTNKFNIEFRYLDDEEPRQKQDADDDVTLTIGRRSGRLYAIQVDVESKGVEAVLLNIHIAEAVKSALDKLERNPTYASRKDNYRLAGAVVDQESEQLFRQLKPA